MDAGHTVIGVASIANAALGAVRSAKPDLALVNIKLADGSRGTDVARTLLKRFGVRSLFVSGSPQEARLAADAALGFICKPYNPQDVLASIEVAKSIMAGQSPAGVPSALELFDRRPDA